MALRFITNPVNFSLPPGSTADAIDWSFLPDNVALNFNGQPVFPGSTPGTHLGFGLWINNQHLIRRTQGGPVNAWNGSFAQGDALLYTDNRPGPLHIIFNTPVRGVATQLNVNDPVSHYRMAISAFSVAGTRLPVPRAGTRTDGVFRNGGGGQAECLGVIEDNPNRRGIASVVISVTVLDQNYTGTSSFAINQLRLAV
jgi:hypothetical protein